MNLVSRSRRSSKSRWAGWVSAPTDRYVVEDLLTGERRQWCGERQPVRFDPAERVGYVWRVVRTGRGGGAMSDAAGWYKDAIIYELHVRAFHDSDGDGIGDFRGPDRRSSTTSQDLGVTALWLLPFYPSPLHDDGYDIADYTDVHPAYGTLQRLPGLPARGPPARAARHHRAGASTTPPTSTRGSSAPGARRPGSRGRDFYVWSDTPDKYPEARIIFKDFEPSNWTWDPVAERVLLAPLLLPPARPELRQSRRSARRCSRRSTSGSSMGVDGLRLDAVPYLYEREGTNCENLPETHAFLKELRRTSTSKFANRMLLAEANQWPEDAVAYFGDGDECHMAFHFPLMPRLFMAIQHGGPLPDHRHPASRRRRSPRTASGRMFLRNHDELTLEMVTDEERDYMYRVYAARPAGAHQPRASAAGWRRCWATTAAASS